MSDLRRWWPVVFAVGVLACGDDDSAALDAGQDGAAALDAGRDGAPEIDGQDAAVGSDAGADASVAACTRRVGDGEAYSTIQAAVDDAAPGDVICVQAGTYALIDPIRITMPATDVAPLEIRAEGSVTLTDVDLQLGVWSGMFQVEGASWVTLRGFHLADVAWFGVMVESSDHVVVEGFRTERSRASGIYVGASSNVTVSGNEVGFCCLGTSSVVNGDGDVVGSQECISIAATTQFDVGHNDVHDSPVAETGGEGIDVKAGSNTGRVHHNRVHDLVRVGIYLDAFGSDVSDVEVDSNEVFHTYVGVILGSEEGGSMSNVALHDNVLHHNGGDFAPESPNYPWNHLAGIEVSDYGGDGPRSNIAIYSNTVVSNTYDGQGIGVWIHTANASDVVVRNNLIAGQPDGIVAASEVSVTEATNNLVYPFTATDGEIEGDAAVHDAPLFVDEDGADYHLEADSPAVDSGAAGPPVADVDADGNARVAGSAVDIGAYEHGSTAP